jgi:hypothetical protein
MHHELFYYEFEIKYYQWRLKEAQKEYESGFERLAQIKSYLVKETLEAIQTLSQEEKYRILPILIKKSEGQFLELLGDSITDEEEAIFKRFYTATQNNDLRARLREQEKILKKYSKRNLKKIIKNALSEILQPVFYSDICFDTQISNNWKISTFIIIENGYCYDYSHTIRRLNENNIETRIGTFTINLSTWLGLYPAGWVFTSDEDIYKSANEIAVLCKYFIDSFAEWNLD